MLGTTAPFFEMSFSPVHFCNPTAEHTFTAILLHGRGSSGPEFAEDLLTSHISEDGDTMQSRLPGWRWVFPSAPLRWSTAFQEDMPAWFEAHSLTDPSARQDLQISGIRESVVFLSDLIQEESKRLKAGSRGIVIGGISQGAAIGLLTMLHQRLDPLAGFVATSSWLPFANEIRRCIQSPMSEGERSGILSQETREAESFVGSMLDCTESKLQLCTESDQCSAVPVFLGHGVDDIYVDVGLGRQVRDVLRGMKMEVIWKEYSGAEGEGHWLKEPEEVADITDFLSSLTHT